jgi:hypothetical protein
MLCRIRTPHQPTAALASMGQDKEPVGRHTKAPVEAGRVQWSRQQESRLPDAHARQDLLSKDVPLDKAGEQPHTAPHRV